jgi:hypothetical protein
MFESDDYGFFCDLENTKTMYYEHAEYYLAAKYKNFKVTHWEVCRKTKYIEPEFLRVRRSEVNHNKEHDNKHNNPKIDLYYSFLVCVITIASVYLVMTIPDKH